MTGQAHSRFPTRAAASVVACGLLLIVATAARATDYDWDWAGGSGNWNQTSRWNPNGHPRADDTANVINDGAEDITVYYYSDYPDEELDIVRVDADGTGTMTLFASSGDALNAEEIHVYGGTVDQRAGEFAVSFHVVVRDDTGHYNIQGGSLTTPFLRIGGFESGQFDQSGGCTVNVTDTVYLGAEAGAGYSLDGGKLVADTVYVGCVNPMGGPAPGTLHQTGGQADVDADLYVGDPGGAALYDLDDGTLTTGALTVGYYDSLTDTFRSGTVEQTGGTVTVCDTLVLGEEGGVTSSEGAYTLSGSSVLDVTNGVTVGDYGEGSFTQTGASHTVGTDLCIGHMPGSDGEYSLGSGGTLTVHGDMDVGYVGTGRFTQTSGTTTVDGALGIGPAYTGSPPDVTSGEGTLTLAGGILDTGGTMVGGFGTGTVTQTGGDHDVHGVLTLGSGSNTNPDAPLGDGTYDLSGTGELTVDAAAMVGKYGTGAVVQDGGTAHFKNLLYLGFTHDDWYRADGSYTLSGTADLVVDGTQHIGYDADGTFTQTGGTHTAGSDVYLGTHSGAGGPATGTYHLSGTGTFHAAGCLHVGYNGVGTLTQEGGTLTADGGIRIGSDDQGEGSVTLSGGTLETPTHAYVGRNGEGTVDHSGGTFTVGEILFHARLTGSHANYTLSGTGVLDVRSDEYLGYSEWAGMEQSGGTHDVGGSLYLAWQPGGSAVYDLSGGDLAVHGNETLGYAAIATFTQSGGDHHVDGNLDLGRAGGGRGLYTMTDGTAGVDGALTLTWLSDLAIEGGTFTANHLDSASFSTFRLLGGQFLANTVQHTAYYAMDIDGGSLSADEFTNDAEVRLHSGSIRGRSDLRGLLTNNGTFLMEAGNFYDTLVNHGTFRHEGGRFHGFLEHRGLFVPAGDFHADAGIENYATLTVAPEYGIWAEGDGLANHGAVAMAGGILGGDAGVVNDGTLGGYGFISGTGALTNAGTLAVQGGRLEVQKDTFTNTGLVQMADAVGQLAGTALENAGTLGGFGTVACDVTNDGLIEPAGGTLVLTGAVSNQAAGRISVSTGNKLAVPNSLGYSYGSISLAGGVFETDHVTNYGQVAGYGTFRSTRLDNYNEMVLSGGSATVEGFVVNQASGEIEVRYQPAVFTGDVTNAGDIKVTDTTVTFLGTYSGSGSYVSDPADNYFQDVQVAAGGAFVGGAGDRFLVRGDFLSETTNAAAWDTADADLLFLPGDDDAHTFTVTGAAGGGWTENFAWGGVTLEAGQAVSLVDDAAPGGALYASALTLEADTALQGDNLAVVARTVSAGDGLATVAVDVIVDDALEIEGEALGTLVFGAGGLLDNSGSHTITKTGEGLLVIDRPQDHGPGALFAITEGTVAMNTDASGTGDMDDADLSILVEGAQLDFGHDQHLDTLEIADGGLVRFTGANVVVVKNLVMDGVPLGATTLTPEPASLALLALGGLGLLARRRRRKAA